MIATCTEGRAHHCGHIARLLRGPHAAAVTALGFDPHREMRAMLDASSFTRALLIDGRLAALGGVVGPALASEGHVWLAVAARAAAHPRLLLTEARRQIADLAATRHALVTTILDGDAPALCFACHLGFVRHNFVAQQPGVVSMRLDLRS